MVIRRGPLRIPNIHMKLDDDTKNRNEGVGDPGTILSHGSYRNVDIHFRVIVSREIEKKGLQQVGSTLRNDEYLGFGFWDLFEVQDLFNSLNIFLLQHHSRISCWVSHSCILVVSPLVEAVPKAIAVAGHNKNFSNFQRCSFHEVIGWSVENRLGFCDKRSINELDEGIIVFHVWHGGNALEVVVKSDAE